MKKDFTLLSFLTKQMMGKGMLSLFCPASSRPPRFFALVATIGCILFSLSSTVVSGQSTQAVAPAELTATGDLAHFGWKTLGDYAAVITSERNNTAQVLASPNLNAETLGLYTGYDRMLLYIQADLAGHDPIENIAENNFNKVVQETPNDLVLKNMKAEEFSALYSNLVKMLQQ